MNSLQKYEYLYTFYKSTLITDCLQSVKFRYVRVLGVDCCIHVEKIKGKTLLVQTKMTTGILSFENTASGRSRFRLVGYASVGSVLRGAHNIIIIYYNMKNVVSRSNPTIIPQIRTRHTCVSYDIFHPFRRISRVATR